jgi:hypothetical protein
MATAVRIHVAVPQVAARKPFINRERLRTVIKRLHRALVDKRGLFRDASIRNRGPQHLYYPGSRAAQPKPAEVSKQLEIECFVPTPAPTTFTELLLERYYTMVQGSFEHRLWLWFATLTDRREKSIRVYDAHCKLFHDHPEFYTAYICYISLDKLQNILKKYKIGSPNASAGNWQICAFTLFYRFGGDPVALLQHAGWSVASVCKWKKEEKKHQGYDPLPGWGPKLISLYFLYLSELGYTLPDDAFASDVHAQAYLIQTGALEWGDYDNISSGVLAEMLRIEAVTICKEEGFEIIDVAHVSWINGNGLCNGCAKNILVADLCALYDICGGRADTSSYFKQGKWYKNRPLHIRGGIRPPFGMITDLPPRIRGRKAPLVNPQIPLFPSRQK